MNIAKYVLLSLLISSQAHAYLSIAESAEVIRPGTYQLGIEPQIITENNGGTNLNAFIDSAYSDSLSGRVSIGGGATDFNAFASAKFVPFPDFENQPAMGVRGGIGFARDEELNILQIQIAPMVSKKIDTEHGVIVPYFSIPFAYLNTKHDNFVASNLVIGSEFKALQIPDVNFGAEIGLELNKSFSYLSIFATFPFDSQKGFGN